MNIKCNVCFNKLNRAGKVLTVVPVKVDKDMSFKDIIVDSCIKFMEDDNIPDVDVGL